jgi:uncharacterized membrane protein
MRPAEDRVQVATATRFDMEFLVGSILQYGLLLSVALLVAGLAWHWIATSQLGTEYLVTGMNLFQFLLVNIRQAISGTVRPRLLVSLGLAALMMTPYTRVMASLAYFAFVERNWKYTLFTAFVFVVLTYSLFLR